MMAGWLAGLVLMLKAGLVLMLAGLEQMDVRCQILRRIRRWMAVDVEAGAAVFHGSQ